jgi:Holliday junction DNA helicase RuvA
MIAHLRGKLLAKHPNQAIVEAGGVGYDVNISVPTFSSLPETGSEVALFIHMHVREDMLALYGFLQTADKTLFEKLIGVSGIGPKLANTILSGMPETSQIVSAIRTGDLTRLTRIPGVGKKTAERMVLELRDKFPVTGLEERPKAATTPVREDVTSALINLGYKPGEVEKALASIAMSGKPESFDLLFRVVMGLLSK